MASPWLARVLTLVVWALAIGSATVWALRHVRPDANVIAAPAANAAPTVPADLQTVFGVRAVTPAPTASAAPAAAVSAPAIAVRPMSERFALVGVAADARSGGVALISIDGAPARPFEVGARIEDGLRLGKVEARSATLIPKAPEKVFMIELPTGARTPRPLAGGFGTGAVRPPVTPPAGATPPSLPTIRRPGLAASAAGA